MGNRPMAEKMYRKGLEINPRSQRAHINLIVYLSEHGKNLAESFKSFFFNISYAFRYAR